MDAAAVALGFAVGGCIAGLSTLAYQTLAELHRMKRELEDMRRNKANDPKPADILAAAQAEARNRQLAILAAVDLADYVAQNFDGASTEIIKRIAPHLLDKRG